MKKLIIVIALFVIIAIGSLIWWTNGASPANSSNKESKIFVVEKGAGIREISNRLKDEKLIKNPIVFFLLVKQLKLDKEIQAGDFRLSPSMTAQEIAENLTHGTLDIWTTIPEGKRAKEIAEILRIELSKKGFSYLSKYLKDISDFFGKNDASGMRKEYEKGL